MNGLIARIALTLTLLAAALLAGLSLSSVFVVSLLDVDAPLTWKTYVAYVRALGLPEVRPHAGTIKLAGVLGFGVALVGWAISGFFLLRYAPPARPIRRTVPARSMAVTSPTDQPARDRSEPAGNGPKVPIILYTEEGADMRYATQAVAAAASMALAACATPPKNNAASPSNPPMHTDAKDAASPANPGEALGRRLLQLIGGLRSKHDFTAELIDAALGIEMQKHPEGSGAYRTTVPMNERWQYWIAFDEPDAPAEARLRIIISVRDTSKPLPLTEVCLEFESVAAALAQLGYKQEEKRFYKDGSPTGDWRFYRRKPEHEYSEEELALSDLYPLQGQGPVEISIPRPPDEFFDAQRKPEGGRRCVVDIEIEGAGDGS